MIIPILSNLIDEGYLDREKYSLLSPFFAGTNVAFRREALRQAGAYDEKCNSGEDQDICFRIANAGWELYFEPKAVVRHKNRTGLRAFARQWFNYGFHHPYLFIKHNYKGLRIYRPSGSHEEGILYKGLFNMRFPFSILVFLTPFLAMHLILFLAILLAGIGLGIPAIVCGALTVAVALLYFRFDMNWRSPRRTLVFVFLRYTANLALIAGGFLGGVQLKMLYIDATLDYRTGRGLG